MNLHPDFRPPFYLRNAFLQTVLASFKPRGYSELPIVKDSERVMVDAGKGVLLIGYVSRPVNPRGLLLLLHGWEGSVHSAYILKTARHFFERCYTVLRLNLRDHGDTSYLNEGLFNGSLIDEVFHAVKYQCRV